MAERIVSDQTFDLVYGATAELFVAKSLGKALVTRVSDELPQGSPLECDVANIQMCMHEKIEAAMDKLNQLESVLMKMNKGAVLSSE